MSEKHKRRVLKSYICMYVQEEFQYDIDIKGDKYF